MNIDSVAFNSKKALIRVDFNVPLNDSFEITDDKRMQAALPTINKVLSNGGSVVLMSHLGRPKNGPEHKFSLCHLQEHLSKISGAKVHFISDCIGSKVEAAVASLNSGEILLLDNVRFYKEETAGDEAFAEALSQLGDVYINDAFGTAHRAHASTTKVAKYFNQQNRCF
jgi:phosphoglycerate kinase